MMGHVEHEDGYLLSLLPVENLRCGMLDDLDYLPTASLKTSGRNLRCANLSKWSPKMFCICLRNEGHHKSLNVQGAPLTA